ncbi:SLC13 family permease [Stakelama saccharophila]|uniref:SLC13 family permease n=1 Tax=Stakelama saccharophila TaxID=3075605 RepID=A0ABZ0B6L5_9SPHN|nr:SLC13 family permease [Stakelama sp. W311]WNO52935.1 SLC13 family permease [Stakelama sp. W311]
MSGIAHSGGMTPAALSAIVLGIALVLFVSERVRHDLVALLALFACLALGLVTPQTAFVGMADPAVLTVAGILVIGRAVELSGIASVIARTVIPQRAPFTVRLALLLVVSAALSAFMNNIAALVITMPIAADVARAARRPPAATLMPLAFATILGGMTTLIGTPANLILSSVRQKELGAPLGFFAMTPVGAAVTAVGLLYLVVLGWRLLPVRRSSERETRPPWRVFELLAPAAVAGHPVQQLFPVLRHASARLLALFRDGGRVMVGTATRLKEGDHLLVISRVNQWIAADRTGLDTTTAPQDEAEVTARVAVAHGSFLIDQRHEEVPLRSDGELRVVAVGPRAARERQPLTSMVIHAGDQLFLRGPPQALSRFIARARLLEIDRLDPPSVARSSSALILAIFVTAIVMVVAEITTPTVAFVGAAVAVAALRLVPAAEVYRSIDWSVLVLLAAMIPVGQSFETTGAAAQVAQFLGRSLDGAPLFVITGALCATTLLLSIFLNNVATAVIMGPLAIEAARLLHFSPDAALLAVLIGASSDFLTPIGHHNNLLVMAPGGYRFTDYCRMGGILVLLVVGTTAATLSGGLG